MAGADANSKSGDLKLSNFLEQARSTVSGDDMLDAVLCENKVVYRSPDHIMHYFNNFSTAVDTAKSRFTAPPIFSINNTLTFQFDQTNI